MRIGAVAVVVLTSVLALGCGVSIETGETQETAESKATLEARQIQADWYQQFQGATPVQMASLLERHIGSVTNTYIKYGRQVTQEWRKASEGRGEAVTAAEMRDVVGRWTSGQRPLLRAYEDNVEYALTRIRESGFFDDFMMRQIDGLVKQFYDVHNAVFYPGGTADDYADKLFDIEAQTEQVRRDFLRDLERYR